MQPLSHALTIHHSPRPKSPITNDERKGQPDTRTLSVHHPIHPTYTVPIADAPFTELDGTPIDTINSERIDITSGSFIALSAPGGERHPNLVTHTLTLNSFKHLLPRFPNHPTSRIPLTSANTAIISAPTPNNFYLSPITPLALTREETGVLPRHHFWPILGMRLIQTAAPITILATNPAESYRMNTMYATSLFIAIAVATHMADRYINRDGSGPQSACSLVPEFIASGLAYVIGMGDALNPPPNQFSIVSGIQSLLFSIPLIMIIAKASISRSNLETLGPLGPDILMARRTTWARTLPESEQIEGTTRLHTLDDID